MPEGNRARLLAGLMVFSTMLYGAWASADELLDRAQGLMDQKQHQAAYELLIKELPNRAGAENFDLLLGIAALDSGHPTVAVFAFERVLDVNPNNARARAELGRAYFEMNENEAAREEFNIVKGQAIPAEVGTTIDKYLAQLDARMAAGKFEKKRFTAYAEATLGYDSNVNAATDAATITIPALGNATFTLDEQSLEQDSGFIQAGAGLAFAAPFPDQPKLGVFGAANFHEKYTWDETDFRTRTIDGNLGLSYSKDRNSYRISGIGQYFGLDNDTYRGLYGARAAWLHTWNDRTVITGYGQWAAQRFDVVPVRDVDQISGGVGVIHLMDHAGDPLISATIFGGFDDEQQNDRPDVGRDFVGLRMSGEYSYNERTKLKGDFTYQYSGYGAPDPFLRETRKDHFLFFAAGAEYRLQRNWYIKPEVQFIHNDSTLPINDYDRWQVMTTVRYNF
jgi:tetratricopeptide (TPR) repeat protein